MFIEQLILEIVKSCGATLVIGAAAIFIALFFRREISAILPRVNRAKLFGLELEVPAIPLTNEQKKSLERAKAAWNRERPGHLFWFAADIMVALRVAYLGEPQDVKHYVRQCYWHASQLELGELIENRFKELCEKTARYAPNEWNDQRYRAAIFNELNALMQAVAFIAEGKDFQGSPPAIWHEC